MKKNILFLCFLILCVSSAFANTSCFLAKENGKVLKAEGDCKSRYGPQSTFKIALSLIGFDSGILRDENNPSWPCKKGYDYFINVCKGDHNPRTWMRDSCLWYSRINWAWQNFKPMLQNLITGIGIFRVIKGKTMG